MQQMTTKKAAHWEKKSGNTLGTFAELRVVLVQLLVLSLQELHRLPQRRPARLQLLVLLPQLRNPNPKRKYPRKEGTSRTEKTGCGVMVRRGRVNYLRAARVGAAYAGYGGRGGGGRGRELSILRGGGLWRFPRHGVAARVRWRGKV